MKNMNVQKTPQNILKDTGSRVSTTRIVGVVAVAYAASMIVQNAVFAVTGAPDYSDPIDVVLTYHAKNKGALAVTSGLEAMNMILLLLFVTALHGLVQRRGGAGADWSRLAVAAGATLSALFALTIATQIAVVLAANGLSEPTPAFEPTFRRLTKSHSGSSTLQRVGQDCE
jgi:hypothetical protein